MCTLHFGIATLSFLCYLPDFHFSCHISTSSYILIISDAFVKCMQGLCSSVLIVGDFLVFRFICGIPHFVARMLQCSALFAGHLFCGFL